MTVVGFIGLGSMGSCLARRLISRRWQVVGHDPAEAAAAAFVAAGGAHLGSVEAVASTADIVIVALASREIHRQVVEMLAAVAHPDGWVLDINTLDPADKLAARDRIASAGWRMLDCSVSGTPPMVERDLHGFYFSGEGSDEAPVAELIAALAEKRFDMGAFGNAARIKLVINHMVVCHNVVAAEAMSLGLKAGLAPELLYETICASAATSRIFEVRGRMMADETYPPETMYELIVDKDAPVIADFARQLRHSVAMFSGAVQAHVRALETRWAKTDPASLCAVFEEDSNAVRKRA